MSPFGAHFGAFWPLLESQKALKVDLVVMGGTCKLISLCQEPSMCETFLMSLTSHHSCSLPHQLSPNIQS